MKVVKTNQPGDSNYYAVHDIFWAVAPTQDDPGMSYPKPGAIPRDKHGRVLETGDDYEADHFDDEDGYFPRELED